MTKNLTVALDAQSYRKAKIAAAERGVSVSALVRDYFDSLDRRDTQQVAWPTRQSLVDLLGDERLAEVDFEIPRFENMPQPADFE